MERDPFKEHDHEQAIKNLQRLGFITKVLAIILVILSIILLILGLIPQERVNSQRQLEGYLEAYTTIDANKGDIMIIDYDVDGSKVAFYLTYNEPYGDGNYDYIVSDDYARQEHFEIDIEKTGTYYMNFESTSPSNSGTFSVDLRYKIMDRYSLAYILFGVITLVIGLVLTILSLIFRKRGRQEEYYIRL